MPKSCLLGMTVPSSCVPATSSRLPLTTSHIRQAANIRASNIVLYVNWDCLFFRLRMAVHASRLQNKALICALTALGRPASHYAPFCWLQFYVGYFKKLQGGSSTIFETEYNTSYKIRNASRKMRRCWRSGRTIVNLRSFSQSPSGWPFLHAHIESEPQCIRKHAFASLNVMLPMLACIRDPQAVASTICPHKEGPALAVGQR